VTGSKLRQNIDQALDIRAPLEEPPHDKLDNLKRRDCLVGDPEDLVHMDWSQWWRPFSASTTPSS
jgi:hypothetical protein